ncbi:50S ribosomal protein L23 [Candidatus Roizmanbacteria bacterium]|jgi:ribosomal protein L23|nr:50S ribosomal protein L23 [Candidatus Roizmanbacteria bacterium]
MKINEAIVRPVLTEKATNLTKDNVYLFEVSTKANKHQIKTSLENLLKIKIKNIRVNVRKGKTRRTGRRMTVKQMSDRKMVFVKLKEGKIDMFPQT